MSSLQRAEVTTSPPSIDSDRAEMIAALDRYWPRGFDHIAALPIARAAVRVDTPPKLRVVSLPEWAGDIAVDGGLIVPESAAGEGWETTDWLTASRWYLTGAAEAAWERANAPICSYSYRLGDWDARMWERAWVNRIALFLRRWASVLLHREEEELFGPRPSATIVVTHDVDAVTKTIPIRVKQSAFHAFNAFRQTLRGDLGTARTKTMEAFRFFFRRGRLWFFKDMTDLEEKFEIRSHFNFYAGRTPSLLRPAAALIDPGYDVSEPELRRELDRLRKGGWQIGLHQSFGAWIDSSSMAEERGRLERASGGPVRSCRQHWLHFSWQSTWTAQRDAGFELDTTLGFNDRPGFRSGAALSIRPFGAASSFRVLPMVLMDSHLYDYAKYSAEERRAEIRRWIGEIRAVGGEATVLWHQHVMGPEYGWAAGYAELLEEVAGG